MRYVFLLFLVLVSNIGFGQILFIESFDEPDNVITGTENSGNAVTWNTTCPGSVAVSDYFKVLAGKLEGKDTNSPGATWETGVIDISSCTGVNISMSIEELSNMEECIDCNGTGAPCVDWVKLEYNIDATGWTDVVGTTCALAVSPGEMIQIGDIPSGGPLAYISPCLLSGTSLQVRVSCMCWASSEIWRFDDITVSCMDCTLPIELINFSATPTKAGVSVTWSTLSESSNEKFILESSLDGINFNVVETINGAGNSTAQIDYRVLDFASKTKGYVYYRLKQIDFNNRSTHSHTISAKLEASHEVYWSEQQLYYNLEITPSDLLELNIYDIQGQIVSQYSITKTGSIPWSKPGIYFIEIPKLNFRQKILVFSSY